MNRLCDLFDRVRHCRGERRSIGEAIMNFPNVGLDSDFERVN
ncbi:hypothetical protein PCO31111_00639 [Pandoraea communis]|uniref:Uncharacterized protein n=1 Tax=Pandoraea communis TaxID=2508297 RepID=A0A5E4S7V8_9BURK|nr:hypothetical protein PCO31111_00639 [Pandoraea communis]